MRIAVISDIHANLAALQAVINYIEGQGVDKIIFLGDLVMNGPHPKETMEVIKELSPLVWIRGNTDNWLYEIRTDFVAETEKEKQLYSLYKYAKDRLTENDMELLLSKPDTYRVDIEGVSILCVHGSNHSINEPLGIMTPAETLEQLTNEIDADILLCGHTHLPYYASFNGKKIINAGAVSLSIDGEPAASFCILDIKHRFVSYENHKVPYNIKQVLDDGLRNAFPNLDTYAKKLTNAR